MHINLFQPYNLRTIDCHTYPYFRSALSDEQCYRFVSASAWGRTGFAFQSNRCRTRCRNDRSRKVDCCRQTASQFLRKSSKCPREDRRSCAVSRRRTRRRHFVPNDVHRCNERCPRKGMLFNYIREVFCLNFK